MRIFPRSTAIVASVALVAAVAIVGSASSVFAARVGQVEVDATRPGHVELAWTQVDGAVSYTVARDGAGLLTADTLRFDDTTANDGATYRYDVTADLGGSTADVGSRTVTVPAAADAGPPSVVTGVAVTTKTDSTVGLSWKSSSDDVDVVAYLVFSGGLRVAFSEGPKSITVKNLRSATPYTFAVRALDAAGNLSGAGTVSATTLASADTTAPSTPTGVKVIPYSSDRINITWGAATDDHSLAGYRIFRSDQPNAIADVPVALARTYADTTVTAGTTYGYRVESYDSAGTASGRSSVRSAAPLGPGLVKVVRGPLVQQVDRASAQVTWRTNIPAASHLTYVASGVTHEVTDPVERVQHAVLIGGLPADAQITYTISYASDSKAGSFSTCGQRTDPSTLSVVGDFGSGGIPEKDIATRITVDHADAIISTGDNVYPAGDDVDYSAKFFGPYAAAFAQSPFWTAFGNHDYYDPGAVAAHANLAQPGNESWYSFDCSSVHVLVLDTELPFGVGSPQYEYARNDLASATAPWKVVVTHQPPYSSSRSSLNLRTTYQPLFEEFGVQMVFSGHSHNYERSVPINGVTYMVTGGGGNGLNSFSGTPPSWSAFRAAEYHYVQASVTPTSFQIVARRRDGSVLDQNTVSRSGDTTAPDAPTGLRTTGATQDSISLAWNAASDDVGVTGYRVFRDGEFLEQVGGAQTTYTDAGLSADTTYRYEVRAVDGARNTSTASDALSTSTTTAGNDTTPPSIPSNLRVVSSAAGDVEFAWDGSTDDAAIAGYEVFRDGASYGATGKSQLAFVDPAPQAGEQHDYQVRAIDTSNNHSDLSGTLTIAVPSAPPLFADDFEGGSLAAWTFVDGLTVSQGVPAPSGGAWVARETTSCCIATYADKAISPTVKEAYARFRFQVIGRSGSVDLMRFRNAAGGSKFSLLVDSGTGSLATRNAVGMTTKSNAVVSNGTWHTVEVHVKIGAPSVTEVWLDGSPVPQLGNTGDLGTTNVGQFLLGQTSTTGTYDVAFDDVIVSKSFI